MFVNDNTLKYYELIEQFDEFFPKACCFQVACLAWTANKTNFKKLAHSSSSREYCSGERWFFRIKKLCWLLIKNEQIDLLYNLDSLNELQTTYTC